MEKPIKMLGRDARGCPIWDFKGLSEKKAEPKEQEIKTIVSPVKPKSKTK